MAMARSNRQRGFSMIVVFLLLMVMVALAATVLLVTQGDLRSTGQDRVAVESFYGAEAAVAYGKEFLYGRSNGVGAGAWTGLLTSGVPQLCAPGDGTAPGTAPVGAPAPYDANRGITFQFCLHDNAMDPNYFANQPSGDTADGDGIIAIEGYGYGPDGAKSHVSVEVKALPVTVSNVNAYFQSGANERKSATGDGTAVGSSTAVNF
jgi:Tfp pilus assembly protein PilX